MKKLPACVITQVLSGKFYFPTWYKYYAKQLGGENIYLVTNLGSKREFDDFSLGGIISYPTDSFDESVKSRMSGSLTECLLECYETVIVVDADEFIVPDPRKYTGILDYLDRLELSYATCIGLDIIQHEQDADIDLDRAIVVEQRAYGYLTSSLCKTSITRIPLKWSVGYHYCSVYPQFHDVYLFHLKRADFNLQYRLQEHMSKLELSNDKTRKYYEADMSRLRSFYKNVRSWPVFESKEFLREEKEFFEAFFDKVRLDDRDKIYRGTHFNDKRLLHIPEEFAGIF